MEEHLRAVADIPFDLRCVGIVGAPRARAELASRFPPGWEVVAAVAEGAEEVTLNRLWQHARSVDAKVLYAHTKGAANPNGANAAWRQRMTAAVAVDWQRCVDLLDSHDAVGPYWLTPEQFPWIGSTPFFGGNFWWATTSYLRRLPRGMPGPERHWAERWVGGTGPCAAYSLIDGWPGARSRSGGDDEG